ncbi:MAG: glycosyltransferase [Alphaproteobacteria bacterium]|nr:glycosyltransferase [Alphaproteobacteria bacterium]
MTAVLHVISGLGAGGAESSLANLARALQQRGMPQHVVSIGDEGVHGSELRDAGVGLTALNVASTLQAPAAVARLTGVLRRLRPQIVQGWMYHGNLAAALAHRFAPGRAGRHLLWNLRASNMDAARYGRVIRCGAALSAWPEVVIANSEAGAEFHASRGFRPRRSLVIANGIDVDRFAPDPAARQALRTELGIPQDAVVVIHVARVDPMKDHATFLAAMAATSGVVGVMVGGRTGSLRTPPNVRAMGLRHDVARLLAMGDIVISTSAFGEGFSNAIAEGMGAGLVPIATDVGDARRIVGDSGRVVPPVDPAALAAAIAAEAALTPAERAARGARARTRIVENFSLAKAVDAYERLYAALAEQGGPG